MPSLKDLRTRINSVKSTRKITSAMKMVAASKLRRAQEQAEAGRPYAELMARMLSSLGAGASNSPDASPLLVGTGRDDVHLLVVVSADRGLAGGFNAGIVREARRRIDTLLRAGKTVKIVTVGRKARDLLRRDQASRIAHSFEDMGKPALSFAAARRVADAVLAMFAAGEFDVCTLVFNRFKSVVAQVPSGLSLIPFKSEEEAGKPAVALDTGMQYEYEPSEEQILADLLPQNLAVQIYRALLESAAGEQAARMTAMDNATRNAGDMINRLTINYNRSRQAYITKELIEIISGAEAV